MTRAKRVICFVDDDPNELARFARAMGDRYEVITGTEFAACHKELQKRGLGRPDLWVLDLYFPQRQDAPNTADELNTMNSKFFALHKAIGEFREFLASIGQGAGGGLQLLQQCKSAGGPVIMLTRKGMLDDAILCMDQGATAVLKKPMPDHWPQDNDPQAVRAALDEAMMENSQQLMDRFEEVIGSGAPAATGRPLGVLLGGIAVGAVLACGVQWLLNMLAAR